MRLFPADATVGGILERCHVSGTRLVSADDKNYDTGAVVPTDDWRPLTPSHAELLRGATDERRMVEVVRLPDETFAVLAEAGLGRKDIPVLPSADATYWGAMSCAGDALTTTVDPENGGLRIGLHLDNWDQQTCADRLDSRRRLTVNLGPLSRYLLVGEFDAVTICRKLYPTDFAERYPHTDDVSAFVARGSMECLRIRIDPGEGYVAPTELLVHDGSTTGIAQSHVATSTAAFWLGRIPRGVLPSAL
ncbi:hypothetical protein P3T27_002127 [Kitasatospora sp. MAA19]|uniref:hypothetical protein n=1 Tax=Kitasatospora sp. MAA19 TaxID=3035090 RepID=UPI002476AC3A|nr:hypothetical protein [Kitasatospora sp. MAA19]MDH6705417.1 hypothetical protein [Kitasatospora sp. MAA19]